MMRRRAILAAFYFATITPLRAETCTITPVARLQALQAENGLMLVPVNVNDQQVPMLLDTGATLGVLDQSLAASLNLTTGKIAAAPPIFALRRDPLRSFVSQQMPQYYLSNGAKLDHFAIVPTLSMGPAAAKDVRMMVADFDKAIPFRGIIGSDQLRAYDLEIDPRNKTVTLVSQDHCEGQVVYWADAFAEIPVRISPDGQITLQMTLDGEELDTILDTGTAETTLSLAVAEYKYNFKPDDPAAEQVPGNPGVYRKRFGSLSVGGIAIKSPSILLVRDALADRLRDEAIERRHLMPDLVRTPQLVLGMDVLSKLHLYIAYRERKIYVTGASATRAAQGGENSSKSDH